MRHLIAAAALAMLSTSAMAEEFNTADAQIITHRGTNLSMIGGVNKIDKKNKMTCVSDAGCSLVIQTHFTADPNIHYPDGTICTYVDDAPADPGCFVQYNDFTASSFQGKPNLKKGTHTVYTTFTVPQNWFFSVLGYQVVYTLYQHE